MDKKIKTGSEDEKVKVPNEINDEQRQSNSMVAIKELLQNTVAELYEEKDKEISTDIQKRFEKFDTYQQGCIVGYMDRLDDEAK